MSWVFTNGAGDQGSLLGRVIPNTQKMVLAKHQHYKVNIKSKEEQSMEGLVPPPKPYTLV